jgi:hypothetical protein
MCREQLSSFRNCKLATLKTGGDGHLLRRLEAGALEINDSIDAAASNRESDVVKREDVYTWRDI